MLVDHTDVQTVGIIRVLDFYLFAILLNDALFRLIQAKENAHKCTLTGPVLAEQRVDLASLQLKSDVIIGFDPGKLLCNMEHLDYIILCHSFSPLS